MMNILLLFCSMIIYASFGINNLICILISMLSTFYSAKYMNNKNKKILLTITIVLNISILIFFKFIGYNNLFNLFEPNSIMIPLGISYYTFQVLSYLIDVYKDKYKAETNLFNYALYVMYIPYLFIGPINRYDTIKKTLFQKRKILINNFLNGLLRIVWGLFKKMVIAARVGIIVGIITNNTSIYYGSYVVFALLLYSIQLYSDFSGGIDIVLGISKILGIELAENFDRPYLAYNLKLFWRKWHMSLSNWLKDYVYIPLGGNRCSKIRNKLNIIITFSISGLWHGLNYFIWGFIHGIIVAFTPNKEIKHKNFGRIINYIVVSSLWVFFIYPTSIEALKMFFTIFTNLNYLTLFSNFLNLGLDLANYVVLIVAIIVLLIYDIYKNTIIKKIANMNYEYKMVIIGVFSLIILVFGIYGLGFDATEFIYSKF